MNLQELTAKVQAINPQATEQKVSDVLKSMGRTVEQVTGDHAAAIAAKIGGQLQKPAGFTPAPKAKGGNLALSGEAKTPAQSEPAVRTAQQVSRRRDAATVDVLASSSDSVSRVLEMAKEKAAAQLAQKEEALSEQLAQRIVSKAETEIDETMLFFDQFLTVGTQKSLQQFRDVIDAEVVA